jgi:single-stranded-DNA-specific exonuclease
MTSAAARIAPRRHDATPPTGATLGVSRSARGMAWRPRLRPGDEPAAAMLAEARGVTELIGRILVGRGATLATADAWFDPSLRASMPDPRSLRDMEKAAARFASAIETGEAIAAFGDYDVDGAASVALVERYLRAHGRSAKLRIPDRLTEGYGPNPDAMRELVAEGASLILTLDCGTTSHAAIEVAQDLGSEVIVLDHHQAPDTPPPAFATVNPNRGDDLSGQGHLCAAGVVFLFLVETTRILRDRGRYAESEAPDLLALLDLVALATVCDVAPLIGVNRAFVAKGLRAMRLRANPGLHALADAARLKSAPDARSLGFALGPRINAGGRIGDCGLGARLLATDDPAEALRIAAKLERLNAERRLIETAIFADALSQAERQIAQDADASLIAVTGAEWHPGVLGLIASQIADRFKRPAMALHVGQREASGSLRSIPGVDLGAAVRAAVDAGIASKGGGHAMAAGVTVASARLAALRAFLETDLELSVARGRSDQALEIDAVLSPRAATLDLMAQFARIGPFGHACPEPRLAFRGCAIENPRIVGNAHVACRLRAMDGGVLDAIAFRAAEAPHGAALLGARGGTLHVAGHLTEDSWGGRSAAKLVIEDVAWP